MCLNTKVSSFQGPVLEYIIIYIEFGSLQKCPENESVLI